MPKFKIANGTAYDCPFCGLASVGILYVDILGVTLIDALTAFSASANTRHMEYIAGGETAVYDGYTKVIGVEYAYNDSSAVRVALRRPYAGEK